ncbi:MAG: sigma-70 family RNA polymerase sigma factor [Nocardioides sp.]
MSHTTSHITHFVPAAESPDRPARTSALFRELTAARSARARRRILDQIVELNLCVARSLAHRYRDRGLDVEDLEQVAYLALVKAAHRFDPGAGHDFLSYAVPTVRGELRRHFRDVGWTVRPPRRIQELQGRVADVQVDLAARLGRSPTARDLAQELGEERSDVEEALGAEGCFVPASLDRPLSESSSATVGDLLEGPDHGHSSTEARVVLAPVVRRLGDRDRRILQLRFFEDRTQREIGEDIGVTQMQVSRLLSRIFADLRADLEAPDATPELVAGERTAGSRRH